jgi:hypothetical protein
MTPTPLSLRSLTEMLWRSLLLLGLGLLLLGTDRAQNKRPVLEQVSNGPADAPLNPVRWVRGACIPNNSHYLEGHYIPYRAVIPGVPLTGRSSIDIVFTVLQNGGLVSSDFFTSYNAGIPHEQVFGHPAEFIDPVSGLGGPFPPKTNVPVPPPTNAFGYDFAGAFERFTALFGQQLMSIWNGTIHSIEFQGYTGQPQSRVTARYTVTFSADRLPVIIAWGGHIADPVDYGEGATAGKGKTELLRLARAVSEEDILTGAAVAALEEELSFDGGGMSCTFSVDGGKPINPTRTIKDIITTESPAAGAAIRVYPNPSRGSLTVDLPRTEGGYNLHLTDGSGRTVRRWSGVQGGQLKANALKPGIYLLEIKQARTGKRVVEKLTVH